MLNVERPLKAYAVLETCEDTGGIVFARYAATARREGSCHYSDGDFMSVTCRRAPWADWCADSRIVPASLMIEHGWHFECSGCGKTVDQDFLADNALSTEDVIGTQDSHVFCCAACKLAYDELEKRKAAFGADFLNVLRDVVRKRFGKVEFRDEDDAFRPSAYVWNDDDVLYVRSAQLSFDFPGMNIAPATIEFKDNDGTNRGRFSPPQPYYRCAAGDREAFEAFCSSTKVLIHG